MNDLCRAILADLDLIRTRAPLILNVTNFVAMDLTANALLALGASPVMAHALEEMDDMVQLAQAIVINMGTLDHAWLTSMSSAVESAHKQSKPVAFDPVGAGANHFRTEAAYRLWEQGGVLVARGNASEVVALAKNRLGTKGVDSLLSPADALEVASSEARRRQAVIAISGETDFIVDGARSASVSNGDPMMAKITAMGCTATSLIGAFLAVNPSPFVASMHAMAVMGICGEKARAASQGPGSFRVAFIDALANLAPLDFAALRVKSL